MAGHKGHGHRSPPPARDQGGFFELADVVVTTLDVHVRAHTREQSRGGGLIEQRHERHRFQCGQHPDAIPFGLNRSTRAFAHAGADPAPAWSDFRDPLDAIAGRFGTRFRERAEPQRNRFSGAEQRALHVLGLGSDTDLHSVRKRYSELVRRYHPDRNGGDRRHEGKLGQVLEAWQVLKTSPAFA